MGTCFVGAINKVASACLAVTLVPIFMPQPLHLCHLLIPRAIDFYCTAAATHAAELSVAILCTHRSSKCSVQAGNSRIRYCRPECRNPPALFAGRASAVTAEALCRQFFVDDSQDASFEIKFNHLTGCRFLQAILSVESCTNRVSKFRSDRPLYDEVKRYLLWVHFHSKS